jgi:hypothetical protein
MRSSKPYFKKEIEDKIVSVILTELSKESKTIAESAIRKYIQSPKNVYENGILTDVADGKVLASVIRNEVAYKVNTPSKEEIDDVISTAEENQKTAIASGKQPTGVPTRMQVEIAMKQTRAAKLSHALNMVNYYGKVIKLDTEATVIATNAVEAKQESKTTAIKE